MIDFYDAFFPSFSHGFVVFAMRMKRQGTGLKKKLKECFRIKFSFNHS